MPDGANLRSTDLTDPWLRTYFINRRGALDYDRSSYFQTWQQEAAMFAPKRGKFFTTGNDSSKGRRKDQRILDNTGRLSARTFTSGMMAGATSPARPWFRLRFSDDDVNDSEAVKIWLDEVRARLLAVFERSNVYTELHKLYWELGVFSTACMIVDEDEESIIRCQTLTAGEYWLAASKTHRVDTLYHSFWWTVRQIVEEFGRDPLSGAVRTLFDAGQLDKEFEVLHAIEPNPNAQPADQRIPANSAWPWDGRLSSKFPLRSVWLLPAMVTANDGMLLRVSGYEDFPAICPRWSTASNEVYGSDGPGEMCVGDTQELQVAQRDKKAIISRLGKPPMVAHPSMRNEPMSSLPAGVTFDGSPDGKSYRPAYEVNPRGVDAVREDVGEMQQRIKEAWFVPFLIAMLTNDREQPDTAREVDEKHDEKMLMLGPMLEAFHNELARLIRRTFNIMVRHPGGSLIPPPPDGVNVAGLKVQFVSVLAQAQMAADLTATERWIQFGVSAREAFPEMLDNVDPDETYRDYGDKLGVPAKNQRDPDKVTELRQQRAKQQEMQAAPDKIKALAQAAQAAGNIDVGGGQTAAGMVTGGGA